MPKTSYSWNKVSAGDIISFRYKGKKPSGKLVTILVLNPKIRLHDKKAFYLVGLKLEQSGVVPHIRNKNETLELLERVGDLEIVDFENEIYRVSIKNVGVRGFKESDYQKLKKYINQHQAYRTFVWEEATNSQVFLEPIKLPKGTRGRLVEN